MTGQSLKLRGWSAYVIGGAAVLLAGLLWQGLSAPPAALAQIPDSGSQRLEMIKELQISNQRLAEITGLLREIRDLQAGEKKDKERKPPAEKP
jgi:hypothetical protein